MNVYAFSQAFISGFFAFAAVSSLAIWLRTRKDWALLLLAAVCAIGSVQSVAVLSLPRPRSWRRRVRRRSFAYCAGS
jgi:hypothetical protein